MVWILGLTFVTRARQRVGAYAALSLSFVPSDLPDGQVCEECWFNNHTCIEIELEDGTHITGWVRGGEAHLDAEFATRRGH